AVLIAALILILTRAVLTPQVPYLRLVPTSNETSSYLYLWIRRITITCIAGFLVAEIGLTLGLSLGLTNGIRDLIGLVVTGMLIVFLLQNRRPVAAFLGGTSKDRDGAGEEDDIDTRGPVILSLRRLVADIWHILAIVYLVIAYGIWALSIEGGFEYMLRATVLSIVILLAAHFISRLIIQAIQRIFLVSPELKRRDPGLERRANRYLPILGRIVRTVIFLFAIFIVLDVWGLGTLELLRGEFGRRLAASVATIAMILAAAFILWQIVSQVVAAQLAKAERDGRPPSQTQRLRTLLPLLRNAMLVILVMIATFMTLSELGINIAPLLAGAGVVGLAIGFGAQTLVKDVITGLFNIMENTIAIGDVVEVGGHGGLVEGMTIRTVRLRDLSGNVHTVPFSEVTSVMNMTRDFSYYVFDIGVAYRENVDEVIQAIKEIGAGLQKDMPYSALILAPIEILGVDAFADSAVVIKARIKTTPINQWTVGREFNRRMKNRFDELGIEIPFPHMTLYFGADKQGKAPPAPIALSAPEVVAALAAGRTESEASRGRRPRKAKVEAEEFETPIARGDEAAESSPGHDGEH
ncbi:MAG: mechanosensitive ion channel, partial [Rhodospirillaceae bacterium]|nr:mechanosensitive ion channel [Rhodospirillaceae bacterium]